MPEGLTPEMPARPIVVRPEFEAPGHLPAVILYIDERPLTRDCISRQLATQLGEISIEPVSSVRDAALRAQGEGRYALAVLHTHMASITDRTIAGELALLGQSMPDLSVVLLSGNESPDSIVGAFQKGIRGYIPTSLSIRDAAAAIRFVWGGGTFVPPSALTPSTRLSLAESPSLSARDRGPGKFTPRQREVLGCLWKGKANKAIAYELNMCESTVKVHIRHIMKKLHARNRTQVVLLTQSMAHGDMGLGVS
jgi:DNA-binding NarL/FixJ family response regulator